MGFTLNAARKPIYSRTPTQTVEDLQAGVDYAELVGGGLRGTSAERLLLTSADVLLGQTFVETDTGSIYVWLTGWRLVFSPWKDYTPTLTGFSAGSGAVVGRYTITGGKVDFWVDVTLGSGFGVTGAMYVSVPLTASTSVLIAGSFLAIGPSGGRLQGAIGFDNASRVWMLRTDNNFLSNTAWAWASGNRVSIHGSYLVS